MAKFAIRLITFFPPLLLLSMFILLIRASSGLDFDQPFIGKPLHHPRDLVWTATLLLSLLYWFFSDVRSDLKHNANFTPAGAEFFLKCLMIWVIYFSLDMGLVFVNVVFDESGPKEHIVANSHIGQEIPESGRQPNMRALEKLGPRHIVVFSSWHDVSETERVTMRLRDTEVSKIQSGKSKIVFETKSGYLGVEWYSKYRIVD